MRTTDANRDAVADDRHACACIQVRAPDKPIEINLNVKIQQEVIFRLQDDAKQLIDNKPELFPE